MTVYVDPIRCCVPTAKWRYRWSCHLLPHDLSKESLEELHHFAASIGLRRAWFQLGDGRILDWETQKFISRRRVPHYDLSPNKRAVAIAAGAVDFSSWVEIRELFQRLRGE